MLFFNLFANWFNEDTGAFTTKIKVVFISTLETKIIDNGFDKSARSIFFADEGRNLEVSNLTGSLHKSNE